MRHLWPGLGVDLVHSIFGDAYFNWGDSSVFTAAINGVSYAKLMLIQISVANLSSETKCLRVKLLNGKYDNNDITDLNIYELLSALYTARATDIINCIIKTAI